MLKPLMCFVLFFATAVAAEDEESSSYLDESYQIGQVRIGPQPDAEDFALLAEQGIKTVINMRRASEMQKLPFLQDYLTQSHQMQYHRIPIGGDEHPYSPDKLRQLAEILQQADGQPVLMHCASGYRASQMYAAYLVAYKGHTPNEALALVSPSEWWPMPMEKLLDKKLIVTLEEK